ncbi:helix-turn-helix domain-containing protein [Mucilaginibacter terrae]|uniref:Transcriptional regulator with XRE-family HTH domain n=1 Tax=Mucilaginibacter terrae TaxID=1955052 RepID=A0ABU3GUV0_9SPHI|nr:helix-turn-helix transcriptional regulator [Mucilaginibacter terrae]MDT3403561.1 transcriptional regulator with XRE-family HTH domain [Mucilaginibacter terrae]
MQKEAHTSKIKSVATNIRKIREYRNYTQEYLAVKLDISQNAYSKIELGYTKITLERLFQIAQILEVDVIELIKANDNEVMVIINSSSLVEN